MTYDNTNMPPSIIGRGQHTNTLYTSVGRGQPQVTVEMLKASGHFADPDVRLPRRLIISIAGQEKTGKNHLAFTAPDPLIFFNLDKGSEGVIQKFLAPPLGPRQILEYQIRVPKGAKQDIYKDMWEQLKQAMKAAWMLQTGTVILDTGTEAYELSRLAAFGKLEQVQARYYGELNAEWREIIRMAYDAEGMSTIFLHKMRSKWVNNQRTGEMEMSGFTDMGYNVQMNIITFRDPASAGADAFRGYIKDCRHRPELNGMVLQGPMLSIKSVLSMVHPE